MSSETRRWFGAVTAEVMFDPSIPCTAKAVYATLACYADKSGACFVSNHRLATNLGVSSATAKRAINDLVEAGVIRREPRWVEGRQQSSVTVLVDLRTARREPPGVHQ